MLNSAWMRLPPVRSAIASRRSADRSSQTAVDHHQTVRSGDHDDVASRAGELNQVVAERCGGNGGVRPGRCLSKRRDLVGDGLQTVPTTDPPRRPARSRENHGDLADNSLAQFTGKLPCIPEDSGPCPGANSPQRTRDIHHKGHEGHQGTRASHFSVSATTALVRVELRFGIIWRAHDQLPATVPACLDAHRDGVEAYEPRRAGRARRSPIRIEPKSWRCRPRTARRSSAARQKHTPTCLRRLAATSAAAPRRSARTAGADRDGPELRPLQRGAVDTRAGEPSARPPAGAGHQFSGTR